jgi:hypothetical protein
MRLAQVQLTLDTAPRFVLEAAEAISAGVASAASSSAGNM